MKRLASWLLAAALLTGLLPGATAAEEGSAGSWSVGVYLCGTNLERIYGSGSDDIIEMLNARIPEGVNVLILTGGAKEWTSPETLAGEIAAHKKAGNSSAAAEKYLAVMEEVLDAGETMADDQLFRIYADGSGQSVIEWLGKGAVPADRQNMGEAATAMWFFDTLVETCPAGHYLLSFWDHGGGPNQGAAVDERQQFRTDQGQKDNLTTAELAQVLRYASEEVLGGRRVDLVGFDCCLMSSVEVAAVLAPYADYMVASEESEPGTGWSYEWLSAVGTDYDGDGSADAVDVGQAIVDTYGLSLGAKAADLSPDDPEAPGKAWDSVTGEILTVIDLGQMEKTREAFDRLGAALDGALTYRAEEGDHRILFGQVARCVGKQVRGMSDTPELVDLVDFCRQIYTLAVDYAAAGEGSQAELAAARALSDAAGGVLDCFGDLDMSAAVSRGDGVIAYRGVGQKLRRCGGLSFYYPVIGDSETTSAATGERDPEVAAAVIDSYDALRVSDKYVRFLRDNLLDGDHYLGGFQGQLATLDKEDGEHYGVTLPVDDLYYLDSMDFALTVFDPEDSVQRYLGTLPVENVWLDEKDEVIEDGRRLPASVLFEDTFDGSWWTLDDQFLTADYTCLEEGGVRTETWKVPGYISSFVAADGSRVNVDGNGVLEFGRITRGEEESTTLNAVWLGGDGKAASRGYAVSDQADFTFRPVQQVLETDGETGKITVFNRDLGQKITLSARELSGKQIPLTETELEIALGYLYLGYFRLTDLLGNVTWSDRQVYLTVPENFAGLIDALKPIPGQLYTGRAVEPAISFGTIGDLLTEVGYLCYDLSYVENVGLGTATVVVTLAADEAGGYPMIPYDEEEEANNRFAAPFEILPAYELTVELDYRGAKVYTNDEAQDAWAGGEAVLPGQRWTETLTLAAAQLLETPVWEGTDYTFGGWYTGLDGAGEPMGAGSAVEGTTYHAKWVAANGKTVYTQPIDLSQPDASSQGDLETYGWYWDADAGTLTLDSAVIDYSGSVEADATAAFLSLYLPGREVELVLKGESTLRSICPAVADTAALCSRGGVTVTGGGTLNIVNTRLRNTVGLTVDQTMTLENGKLVFDLALGDLTGFTGDGSGLEQEDGMEAVAATDGIVAGSLTPTNAAPYIWDITVKGFDKYVVDSRGFVSGATGKFRPVEKEGRVVLDFTQASDPEGAFADVTAADWFCDAVERCAQAGLFRGTDKMTFSPQMTATRAMVATLLWRMAGSPAGDGAADFSDVEPDSWYAEAVHWCVEKGLLDGRDRGSFGPDAPVTREWLAAALYSYEQKVNGGDVTGAGELPLGSADAADVSDWAREAMGYTVTKGILTGKPGDRLDPQGLATRAELAAILCRFSLRK